MNSGNGDWLSVKLQCDEQIVIITNGIHSQQTIVLFFVSVCFKQHRFISVVLPGTTRNAKRIVIPLFLSLNYYALTMSFCFFLLSHMQLAITWITGHETKSTMESSSQINELLYSLLTTINTPHTHPRTHSRSNKIGMSIDEITHVHIHLNSIYLSFSVGRIMMSAKYKDNENGKN